MVWHPGMPAPQPARQPRSLEELMGHPAFAMPAVDRYTSCQTWHRVHLASRPPHTDQCIQPALLHQLVHNPIDRLERAIRAERLDPDIPEPVEPDPTLDFTPTPPAVPIPKFDPHCHCRKCTKRREQDQTDGGTT